MKEQNSIFTPRLLSTLDFPLRWVDVDAYHHVSQTRYIDAMTETRAQWITHAIKDNKDFFKHYFFYVIDTQCTFYRSFKYPGFMRVKQYLIALQQSNFTLQYIFSSPENEKMHAQGFSRLACIDPKTERPTRIPEILLSAFTQ